MCPFCSMSDVPFEDFMLYLFNTASEKSKALEKLKNGEGEFSCCPELENLIRSLSAASTNSNDSASSYYLTDNISRFPKLALMRLSESSISPGETKFRHLYPELASPTHTHRTHDLSFFKNFSAVSSMPKKCCCKCTKCAPLSDKQFEEELEVFPAKKLSRSTPIQLEIVGDGDGNVNSGASHSHNSESVSLRGISITAENDISNTETISCHDNHICKEEDEENVLDAEEDAGESRESEEKEENESQRDYNNQKLSGDEDNNAVTIAVISSKSERSRHSSSPRYFKEEETELHKISTTTIIDQNPTSLASTGETVTVTTSMSSASNTTMSLFLDAVHVTQQFDAPPQQLRIFYKY